MAAGRVELAVVGGGLNGMTLGIACASAGLAVAVLDREDPATILGEPFDGRASAIAYGSMRVLDGIGVWPLVAGAAEAIREIRVADNSAPFFLHYDHREIGDEPLGWMVENRHLRRALAARAGALPNLRLLAPLAVERAEYDRVATLTLADGGRLEAELVAAADGKRSPLREAAGIPTITWSYPQTGIVTTVRHARPHHGVAVEHFLPAGPFAILPLTDSRSSIVWTEDAAAAPAVLALDAAAFDRALQRRFGDFLGEISRAGPLWSYPLGFLHAARYFAPRLVLVGEAAHVIHPIAGQGLNLGIRDIAALAECLVDGRRLGLDLADPTILARYQSWRRVDTVVLAGVTDGLNRLFSNAVPPLRIARDLGLASVGRVPPLKRLFMRHAMGMLGDLPRLARGEAL